MVDRKSGEEGRVVCGEVVGRFKAWNQQFLHA